MKYRSATTRCTIALTADERGGMAVEVFLEVGTGRTQKANSYRVPSEYNGQVVALVKAITGEWAFSSPGAVKGIVNNWNHRMEKYAY